jgi:hypothetical protein
MQQRFAPVLAGALLVAGLSSPALAQETCKPVVGHFEASLVPAGQGHCPVGAEFCTAGRVWGGIQGTYQFVMTAATPSILTGGVPTILFFTGKSTVFLKSGEQLEGTDTGSIDIPPGRGGFASLITFGPPTDPGSAASGQIRLRGEFDAAENATTGDYIGTICTP